MNVENIIKITIVQFNPYWQKPEDNRNKIQKLLEKSLKKTDVIILPEMFTTGFTMNVKEYFETMQGPTVEWMKKISCMYNSAICGSIIIREKEKLQNNSKKGNNQDKFKYYNRFIWVNPSGKKFYYDKRVLFSFVNEDKYFSRGDKRIIIKYKNWKILPLICYDLRFPVLSRYRGDYDLIIYVANWPERRSYPWKQLLIARAIENQSYVIGVNRVGNDNNNIYHSGDSSLITPDGKVSFTVSKKETVKTLEINKKDLITFRKKFPFLKDREYEYL